MKQESIDDFVHQIQALLPEDARRARGEIESNIKAMIKASLQRMDLVTREEFDIQCELLANTRAMLDDLEARIGKLEEDSAKKD